MLLLLLTQKVFLIQIALEEMILRIQEPKNINTSEVLFHHVLGEENDWFVSR